MQHPIPLILAAALLASLPGHAAPPDIAEGEWEFRSEMNMPGMPMKMPPQVFRSCMNRNDPVPKGAPGMGADASCKTTHQFVSANAATWTVRCEHAGQVSETQGRGSYRGNTMEATQTTVMQGQTMTLKTTGRHVGPCKSK